MKILFLQAGIGYAGASKMLVNVANNLGKAHDVKILTYRMDSPQQKISDDVEYEFNRLFSSKFKPIEIIGQIVCLHRYLKENNVDLIIAFLHPANYMATLARIGTNTKVLLSERGDPYSRRKNGNLFVSLVEKIIQSADFYVFQSSGAANAYPMKCRLKGMVIPNALPKRIYPKHNVGDCKKEIICVARLEILQKRQDVLLEAFKLFNAGHTDYRLVFVGDGPDEDIIKEKAKELGIAYFVDFLGARSDVLELIASSKMFVLCSDYEGLPNALLEAMAIGTPCITTNWSPGGAVDIIHDNIDGFIVPCEDCVTLANRMERLADDSVLCSLFSDKSKEVFKTFDPELVEQQWNSLIDKVL